mgnify:FL=1
MKRKGRKSKTADDSSNGVGDREEQNGEASERDEQESEEPEEKKRKSGKRKSSSKKADDSVEEEPQYEVSGVEKNWRLFAGALRCIHHIVVW